MRMTLWPCLVLAFGASLPIRSANAAQADGPRGPVCIEVVGHRALEAALSILGDHLGCVITYEDPSYDSPKLTEEEFPGGFRAPRKHAISFRYTPGGGQDEKLVIESLLEQYHKIEGAAEFKVSAAPQGKGIFNVCPARVQDKNGQWVVQESLLSRRITLQIKNETFGSTAKRICGLLNEGNPTIKAWSAWAPDLAFRKGKLDLDLRDEPVAGALNQVAVECQKRGLGRVAWSISRDPISPVVGLYFHPIGSESANPVTVHVAAGRPVAEAVEILNRLLGSAISYEDPEYLCADDVMRDKSGMPRVPRGDILSFCLPAEIRAPEAIAICLEAYHQRGWAGTFALRPRKEGLHVLPTAHKNEKGEWAACSSILENGVSLSGKSQTARDLIVALCEGVETKMGKPVVLKEFPDLPLTGKQITYQGMGKSARDDLTELTNLISQMTRERLSWRLLYYPDLKGYGLHIYRIEGEQAPKGGQPLPAK